MVFIKRYKLYLQTIGILLILLISLSTLNKHIDSGSEFVSKYKSAPEHIVVEEKKIQDIPIEIHTVEEQKIPIFVYHSVRPYSKGESEYQDLYDITPELFEKQLEFLKENGYNVITPADLFVSTSTGKVVTSFENPVMLTFDDGWENQYQYAYPLLKNIILKQFFMCIPIRLV